MEETKIKGEFIVDVDFDYKGDIEEILKNIRYIMEKYTEGENWYLSSVHNMKVIDEN